MSGIPQQDPPSPPARSLAELLEAMLVERPLEYVAALAASLARSTVGAACAWAALADDASGAIQFTADPASAIDAPIMEALAGAMRRCLDAGIPVRVELPGPGGAGIPALCLPGRHADGAPGAVAVAGRDRPFDAADEAALRPVADALGHAAVHERRSDTLRRHVQTLNILNDLLFASLDAHSIPAFLDHALDLLLSIEGFELVGSGAFFLLDEATGGYPIVAERGLPAATSQACRAVKAGECLCGVAAAIRLPVFADSSDVRHKVLPGMEPHGHFCVPVVSEGRTLAVLRLDLRHGHRRRVGEEEFLVAVADCLAGILSRLRTEARLIESERRYDAVFHSDFAPMLLVDPADARIVSANDRAAALYGEPAERLAGRSFLDLEAAPDPYFATRLAGIAAGAAMRGETRRHRGKSGAAIDVEVSLGPVEHDGRPLLLALVHDVTERKSLAARYQQAQKMEVVGRLAGGIAHDFNNLITVIGGFAEMLDAKFATDDPRRTEVREILGASRRATDLTRQLLAMSRRQVIEPRPTRLAGHVDEVGRMIARLIGEDIRLSVEHSDPSPLPVLIDPGQFEQCLLNLAINARDAMPGGGQLALRTSLVTYAEGDPHLIEDARPGRYARIEVRDTGCGMTPEVRSRIFEPFFTTKREGEGTGLGLSIVYGAVRQNGGFITLYSEVGQGTVFALHFPALDDAAGSAAGPSHAPAVHAAPRAARPARSNGERLLFVEDDDTVRLFAETALRSQGYHLVTAADTADAVARFESDGPFDLVVSDVVLADRNGVDLVDDLSRRRPGLRILLTSGYPDARSKWEEILGRGYVFLQKPYTLGRLRQAVRSALDGGEGEHRDGGDARPAPAAS